MRFISISTLLLLLIPMPSIANDDNEQQAVVIEDSKGEIVSPLDDEELIAELELLELLDLLENINTLASMEDTQ